MTDAAPLSRKDSAVSPASQDDEAAFDASLRPKTFADYFGQAGVKEKLAEQGLTTVGDSPEQFRAFIASETAKWAKVIKDAGIQTTK